MLIFAHRGVSTHYPENTLLAISKALASPCQGIEIDVYAHSGELIVIHDQNVSRTTNGHGFLQDYSWDELRKLDAGQGEQIPTLWQVLELCANRTFLNIELKGHDTGELLLPLLARAQQELGLQLSHILVSSFHHPLLQALKQAQPELQIGALSASYPLNGAHFASQLQAYSVHFDKCFIDAQLVADAHQRGLKVFVYTVHHPAEAKQLEAMGVDGIFCNDPSAAARWF